MLNDLLRTIGGACIIAGAALYFTVSTGEDPELITENNDLKDEITTLQSSLERTEEELANLQSLTADAKKSTDELQQEEKQEVEDSQDAIIKTVLVIESGTTSKDVANRLAQSAIIEDAELLNAYLTANDLSGKIQIGEYHLDSSMSIRTIAKHITTLN